MQSSPNVSGVRRSGVFSAVRALPWHFLYFLPDPHGQGALTGNFLLMAGTFYFLILPQQCAFPAERYDEGNPPQFR
jgi:hypothetical protein